MQEPKTYYSKLLETKEKLNAVGKGFCLMKWQTETLYLHMGDNHSCYHPRPHKILLSDIKRNPSGLHNTAFKKEQRKVMLEGGRPNECQYCWNVEDLEGDHVSDRMVHSTSDYAIKDYDAIRNLDANADWNPRHIEILREELQRAKKILFENELYGSSHLTSSKINSNLVPEQACLSSSKDQNFPVSPNCISESS